MCLTIASPKPGAAQLAAAGLVDPIESLEQPRQVLGRDAAAVVHHANHGLFAVAAAVDADAGPRLAVLDGVVDQIDDRLLQQRAR